MQASADAEGISLSEWTCRACAAVLGVDGLERPNRGCIKPKPAAASIVESAAVDPLDSALAIFD